MKNIYKFNMVEIALAIAIIAIGISAILVLFPIGINATRAAMDENNNADVSEYVANFVRSYYLSHWKKEYNDWRSKLRTDPSEILKFTEPSPNLFETTKKEGDPDSNAEFADVPGDYTIKTDPKSGLRKWGTGGVFHFSRVDAEGEETFSALVKIWSNPDDIKNETVAGTPSSTCTIYVPKYDTNTKSFVPTKLGGLNLVLPNGSSVDTGHFAKSVMVEISWPIHAAEEDRTKRIFRVDVYNPYYTIQPETP